MKRESKRVESLGMRRNKMRLHNVSRGMRIDFETNRQQGARSGATK